MKNGINGLTAAGQRELAALVDKYSSGDGGHHSAIGGVQWSKPSEVHQQLPRVYQPCICVIVQGAKQVLIED